MNILAGVVVVVVLLVVLIVDPVGLVVVVVVVVTSTIKIEYLNLFPAITFCPITKATCKKRIVLYFRVLLPRSKIP
jgi:hypothetical protein